MFGDAPNSGVASGVSADIARDTARTAAASNAFDTAFLPAVFLHIARAVPTEWQAALEAAYGIDRHDSLIRLSGSWPANDHLRIGSEADFLSGPSGSFFGSWRDNDRLRFWARLSF